jgi:thiamine-phosphate pyrophosphorylase
MLPISSAQLYGILDLGYVKPQELLPMTEKLLAGGVDVLQLRAKGYSAAQVTEMGHEVHELTRAAGIPLVINDFPESARAIGCQGVHVGQDDDAVDRARQVVGTRCFVGKSTHSLAQAEAAQAEGADYIGFGPLFATGTKPDYTPIGLEDIRTVHQRVKLPIFCIGGVNADRLGSVLAAGARRVVVVSAFLCAQDVTAEVAALRARLPEL